MNRSFLTATAIALSLMAGGAIAQPKAPGVEGAQASKPGDKTMYTRAQVKAECDAAVKAGKPASGECPAFGAPAAGTSTATRAQVQAECDAMRKAGKMPAAGECPN
jgi:hypothetical protein